MICAYYNKWIPLEQIRVDCGVSRDGANAKNLLVAARSYGFTAKGYRYEPDDLKKHGKFPCIIHWNFNHFVVLDGFKGKKAVINDPAKGTYTVSMEIFDKSFTGICLMFEPNENFVPSGKRKSVLSFAVKRLNGAKVAVVFVVFTTLISALIGVITPAFSRIFMDRLLTHESPDWFYPFLIALSAMSALQLVISALETYYSKISLQQAALAFPIVVFAHKLENNTRKVMDISECVVKDDGKLEYRSLYRYHITSNEYQDGVFHITGEFVKENTPSETLREKLLRGGVPQSVLNKFMGREESK